MRRDSGIIQSKYQFYVDQKRRGIMKMNTESSESYNSSDMAVTETDDEIIL
jgi:uridine phosphorylase